MATGPSSFFRHAPAPAIDGITDQRVADMGHVHADLVRPPGLKAAGHAGHHTGKALFDLQMRDGMAPAFEKDGLPLTVGLVAREMRRNTDSTARTDVGRPGRRAASGRRHPARHGTAPRIRG